MGSSCTMGTLTAYIKLFNHVPRVGGGDHKFQKLTPILVMSFC